MIQAGRHLSILLCAATLACHPRPTLPPSILAVTFAIDGIVLHLGGLVDAVVLGDQDRTLLRRDLCVPTPAEVRLPYRWQSGGRYLVRAVGAGMIAEQVATAPHRMLAELRLRVPVFEAGEARDLEVPATPGTSMDGMLELRSALDRPLEFAIELQSDAGLAQHFTGTLSVEGEVWYRSLELAAPSSGRTRLAVQASWHAGDAAETVTLARTLVPRDPASLAQLVSIAAAEMPADISGARDLRLRSNTLQVPGRWSRLLEHLLHLRSEAGNRYEPVTWQRVTLRAIASAPPLALEVHARVLDERGAQVPALAPPDLHRAGVASTRVWTMLSAGEERVVTLPVYAALNEVAPGHYTRVIALHIPGEHQPFREQRYPLDVIAPQEAPFLVTIATLLAAMLAATLAFLGRNAIFASFSSRDLVLAALVGATDFAIVTLPEIAFFNIVHALLGPLSVVLTGLLTGAVHYTLLACLLVLTPKRGMIALVLVVRLLLAGIVMGQISLVALLYASTNILLLEGALRVAPPRWLRDRRYLLAALLVAGAQGAAVLINFQVSKTLYRFYFADWFVVLSVIVDGALYTWLGCCAGRRIGHGLLRVVG